MGIYWVKNDISLISFILVLWLGWTLRRMNLKNVIGDLS